MDSTGVDASTMLQVGQVGAVFPAAKLGPGSRGVQGCCMLGYGPSPVGMCGAFTEPLSPNRN